MVHVLIEVFSGAISHVLTEGEVTVWLRDYDKLHEQGFSYEGAEQVPPSLYDGFSDQTPPVSFTRPLA